jgi:hypothetical protein
MCMLILNLFVTASSKAGSSNGLTFLDCEDREISKPDNASLRWSLVYRITLVVQVHR